MDEVISTNFYRIVYCLFNFFFIFRVLDLEKKKEKTIISEKLKSKQMEVEEESSDEEVDESFDEFLDWRVKKSHQ